MARSETESERVVRMARLGAEQRSRAWTKTLKTSEEQQRDDLREAVCSGGAAGSQQDPTPAANVQKCRGRVEETAELDKMQNEFKAKLTEFGVTVDSESDSSSSGRKRSSTSSSIIEIRPSKARTATAERQAIQMR